MKSKKSKVLLLIKYRDSNRFSLHGVYASKTTAIKALYGVYGSFRILPVGLVGEVVS